MLQNDHVLESLEKRWMLAVTASYSSSLRVLSISGDELDNSIDVSRNAAGTILINNGAIAIAGGTPTVANTVRIEIVARGGSDSLSLNETNGALPAANIDGGSEGDTITGGSGSDSLFGSSGNDSISGKGGNDQLFGGDGNDVLIGGDGDDQSFGEVGDDQFIWNPGEDTDVNEGGDGVDGVVVNGGNGAEVFTVAPIGPRVRFDRVTPAPFSLDIGACENLVLNANGGDDNVTTGSGLFSMMSVTVDGGAGNDAITGVDGAETLLGGDGNDTIIVLDSVSPVTVNTGPETTSATAPFGDSIEVNTDFSESADLPATAVVTSSDTILGLTVAQKGALRVAAGAVLVKSTGTGSAFSLNGTLDLDGGALLSRAGGPSQTALRDFIARGCNGSGWNGTSASGAINSSLAASNAFTDAVGYGSGAEIAISSIRGFSIAAGDTLVRYTWSGDADLNGKVDGADYARIDSKFNQQSTLANIGGWTNGDFDYNNKIDGADYALIDAAFNSQGSVVLRGGVLGLLKSGKHMITADLNAAWRKSGRGNTADNTLGKLAKEKQIKRTPVKDGRGSNYALA